MPRGRVDVLLEQGEHRIACEVSVTSTPTQELANIRKCLDAGVTRIAVVCPEKRRLGAIERFAKKKLSADELSLITFANPEQLLALLDEVEVDLDPEDEVKTVLGYRVRTKRRKLSAREHHNRERSIARTIVEGLKQLRGKGRASDQDTKE